MSSDEIKELEVEGSVISKWAEQLSDRGILHLHEDGSMGMAFAAPLNRAVNTGPIDRLSIYWDEEELPQILSIKKIDGIRNLVVSVDSNLIPEKIRSLQDRSTIWIRRFRYVMWSFIIISSTSFMIERIYEIQFPNYTAVPRFGIFIFSLVLYGLVGRVYLHGVAVGTPISVYGCSSCGETLIKKQAMGEEGFLSCEDCGADMIPLLEGKPSSIRTQSRKFEAILRQKLQELEKE